MAKASTGIYLGIDSVDVVSLDGSFNHPRLLHSGSTQVPSESSWRSQIRADEKQPPEQGVSEARPAETKIQEPVIRTVHTLLDKIGLPSPRVHVGIAPESVVIRYFQMPTIPPQERKMAISFEAKKYLPFKLEELNTDYQVVINRSDPTLMRVMFFGIKKAAIEAYLSLLKSVNLISICMEPAPISLIRLLRQTGQLPLNEVAAILAVEHDTATISIARHDLLYLSRNVSILTSSEQEPAVPSTELLDALLNETRVSIDYYRRRFMGEPAVGKIIVFGKEMDALRVQELSTALQLPAEMGEPFRKIQGADNCPAELAIATGLALRGLEKKGIETNLLPLEKRREAEGILKPFLTQATAAVVLLVALFGFSIADLNALEKKLVSIQTQQILPQGIRSNQPIPELAKLNRSHQEERDFLGILKERSMRFSRLLKELSDLIPDETWLQHAFLEDAWVQKTNKFPTGRSRSVNLKGSAYAKNRSRELDRINSFLEAIRENDLFNSIFFKFSLDSVERSNFRLEKITEFKMTLSTEMASRRGRTKIPSKRRPRQ